MAKEIPSVGDLRCISEGADPLSETVEALRARGHTVEPDDDIERWSVDGGNWMTDGDLVALAIHLGLMDAVGRVQ